MALKNSAVKLTFADLDFCDSEPALRPVKAEKTIEQHRDGVVNQLATALTAFRDGKANRSIKRRRDGKIQISIYHSTKRLVVGKGKKFVRVDAEMVEPACDVLEHEIKQGTFDDQILKSSETRKTAAQKRRDDEAKKAAAAEAAG